MSDFDVETGDLLAVSRALTDLGAAVSDGAGVLAGPVASAYAGGNSALRSVAALAAVSEQWKAALDSTAEALAGAAVQCAAAAAAYEASDEEAAGALGRDT